MKFASLMAALAGMLLVVQTASANWPGGSYHASVHNTPGFIRSKLGSDPDTVTIYVHSNAVTSVVLGNGYLFGGSSIPHNGKVTGHGSLQGVKVDIHLTFEKPSGRLRFHGTFTYHLPSGFVQSHFSH